MEDKDLCYEEFKYDEVKDESDIDLSSPFIDLSTSQNNTKECKDGDIIIFNDIKTILLLSFQNIQDLFIRFQNKLKEYEAVSEYYECKNINVLPSMKWQTLSDLEVQSKLFIVNDIFEDTFMKIINNMRVMDNAVVRLRNENEKLADVLKLEENNQKKNKGEYKLDSKDLQYQSEISANKILINDLKFDIIDLEEKCKKLDHKLKKVKEDAKKRLEENSMLEEKCEKITKENKKFTKKLADLDLDEYKQDQFKDLTTIVKQNKSILKEIQDTKSKINEHKDTIEGTFLNNLVKKMDRLMESLMEKDSHVKNELLFILKEFKVLRNEMKDVYVLRQKVESLKADLVTKDEQLCEQSEDLREKEKVFNELEICKKKGVTNDERSDGKYQELKVDQISTTNAKTQMEEELNTKIMSQNMKIIDKDKALLVIREKYLKECEEKLLFNEERKDYINQIKLLNLEITKLKEDAKNQCKNEADLKNELATIKAVLEKHSGEVAILKKEIEKYEKEKKSLEELVISMKEKIKRCEQCDAEFNNMNIADIHDGSEVE